MKKTILIALASVTAIGAQAGIITVLDSTDPGIANANLVGSGEYAANNKSREIIRSDTQQFVMAQSFTLADPGAGNGYNLTDIYLKSASPEDFSLYTHNLEMRLYNGVSGSSVGTFIFDISAHESGDINEVVNNDWVKFTLDSGAALSSGGVFSFMFGFDGSTAANTDQKWGFHRDLQSNIGYDDGQQFEGRNNASYDIADWDNGGGDEWTAMNGQAQDFNFYVDAQVVAIPEPSTLGLFAMVGTGILFVRRRFKR